MNASCTGCRPPSPDKPSIVVTSRPSHCAASVRHDKTRLPSTSTVHAPHAPWSQLFLVPVRSSRSRSASSNVTRLSNRNRCALPLTRSVRSTSAEDPRVVFSMALCLLVGSWHWPGCAVTPPRHRSGDRTAGLGLGTGDPVRDDGGVLAGDLLPGEVTGVVHDVFRLGGHVVAADDVAVGVD